MHGGSQGEDEHQLPRHDYTNIGPSLGEEREWMVPQHIQSGVVGGEVNAGHWQQAGNPPQQQTQSGVVGGEVNAGYWQQTGNPPQQQWQHPQMGQAIPAHPAYTGQGYAFVQAPPARRRFGMKFWLVIGGVIGVILVVFMLLIAAEILALFGGEHPEFGYRLDVDPHIYQDMAANEGNFSVDEGYPDFSSTVAVSNFGSGVLIGARWVLTAGHVLLDEEYGEEEPGKWVVSFGLDYENPTSTYSVKSLHVHPAWRADNSNLGLEHGMDIALIELTEPVTDVTPARWAINDTIDGDLLDSTVYTAGFGDYSKRLDDGDGEWWSQKRAWENVLDRLSNGLKADVGFSGDETYRGGFIAYDFDNPEGTKNTLGDDAGWQSSLYTYAGEGDSDDEPLPYEGTSVPGDSGGPTYGFYNGHWWVIGVTSHGSTDGYYGDIAFNTRVSSSAEWICSVATTLEGC